jgi:hypothetical protein
MLRALLSIHWLLALIGAGLVAVVASRQDTAPVGYSRWSPGVAGGAAIISEARIAPAPALAPLGRSVPLSLDGDVGFNVLAALSASGGALRDVTIPPGETWSFNAAVGNPAGVEIRTVGGVPGGGWCDLASRYVQALRGVLPDSAIEFPNHIEVAGVGLSDVAPSDAVSIWNIDGQPGNFGGRQDLLITNTFDRPLRLRVLEGPGPGRIVVEATIGG